MNSQDITRALIDTTVARAMVEMDADPKRSVRKLCDLGRQFSRGRFQNQIFAIFQDLLRNDESPYYQAIDFLLRSNDPEALRQFGINIGYNSFTYGAQILRQKQKELSFAVPWVVKLRLDSRIPDTYDSSFFASVVRTGLTYGIYSYQLRSMDHHEDMESYLAVIQSHPECAFLWFLSDTPLTEKQQKLLLKRDVEKLIAKWEPVMGVKASGVTIRQMKTRWGSCNVRTHHININLALAKKPPECLEYVVVHELTHILEPSHNAVFWGYMTQFYPNWKRVRKYLNDEVPE